MQHSRRKTPLLRTMKKPLLAAGCMVASFTFAALIYAWIYHFYPADRVELGTTHRAFARSIGWLDASIVLEASDWPYTFAQPAKLGSLYEEGNTETTTVLWSKDMSVISVQKFSKQQVEPHFLSAYDYYRHRIISSSHDGANLSQTDQQIHILMQQRGGTGISQSVGDGKSLKYTDDFPFWSWLGTVLVLLGGLFASRAIFQIV